MEGGELNCLYEILESSSHFWDINITNPPPPRSPPPPYIHQNDVVVNVPHQTEFVQQLDENPNSNSSSSAVVRPKKSSKKKQKKPANRNHTWYKCPWTKTEDRKLDYLVSRYGRENWSIVASYMPGRIGKQCRERWHNNLRPNIWKRTSWSDEEELTIIEGRKIFGNRWASIAKFLSGRSENDVKNRWHSLNRKQKTLKKIKRAKRLRHLYQSPILENYIKNNPATNFPTTSSRAAAASSPPTPPPPAFTLTTATNSPPLAAVPPRPFTLTTSTTAQNNALVAIYSTTTPVTAFTQPPINSPIATAATYTPPPFTIFTENYNAISPTFSAPPPISTITDQSYGTLIPNYFTTATAAAATFTPPPTSENYNAIIPTFSTAAATFTDPPPISENHNALSPTFSTTTAAAAASTPAPPMTGSDAVIATDVPLCVDDYDTDGVPYFAFESAMDENSELLPPYMTSESAAIDEDVELMCYDDLIGIRTFLITGDAYYAVDEEVDFMASLFGNIN